jgi:hypothetical protein
LHLRKFKDKKRENDDDIRVQLRRLTCTTAKTHKSSVFHKRTLLTTRLHSPRHVYMRLRAESFPRRRCIVTWGLQADQRLRQRCSTWRTGRTFDCLVYTETCYLIVIVIRVLINVLMNYHPSTKWPLVINKCIVVQIVAVN